MPYDSDFSLPTVLHLGVGSVAKLSQVLSDDGIKKVLLHFGGGSIRRNGCYDQVIDALKAAGVTAVECGGQVPNPKIEIVRQGIDMVRAEGDIDAVLAVGGGSIIDSSKAICAGVKMEEDVWQLLENFPTYPVEDALPLYTVLTLSATGSEMNGGAVISNGLKKYHFSSDKTVPRHSFVDPTFQTTLPHYQTINGVVDAFCHLAEQYVTGSMMQCRMIEGIMRGLVQAGDALSEHPEDVEARSDLAWGATLGLNGVTAVGAAFGGSWLVHMLEHALSAVTDCSHGAGLGVIMPAVWEFFEAKYPDSHPYLRDLAKNVFGVDTTAEMVVAWRDLLTKWGHPVTLTQLHPDFPATPEFIAQVSKIFYDRGEMFRGAVYGCSEQDAVEILTSVQ